MQELIAKEVKCAGEGYVSYEIHWVIPNWRQVRKDIRLVNQQKATFETDPQSNELIQTKWLVGLRDVSHSNGSSTIALVYWQLLDIKGPESESLLNFKAKMSTELCYSNVIPGKIDETKTMSFKSQLTEVAPGKQIDVLGRPGDYLQIGTNVFPKDNKFIHSNGAVQYLLVVTFKKPTLDSTRFKKLKLEQFSKRSHSQVRKSLAAILTEASDGDLKIITSDGVELRVYQGILKGQCPVFAGMLNSELSETQTGIVRVTDISGKTMKIVLHYFYTGDLLNCWSDNDTILEFTYAAGKYQMTQVLNLLDDLLGRSEDEVSNLDLQLLDLAGKLSLKKAEARLLLRIVGKVDGAKSIEDLFQLFGFDSEEILKKGEMMADEQIGKSKVLEIMDYVFGNINQQVDFSQRGLILLALVQRNGSLIALEQILLKRVAEMMSKFVTAEELLAFFGGGK